MSFKACVKNSITPLTWLALIILAALLVRCYHITFPLNDAHAFRQTQTAGLIRDFYRDGINFLYPSIITLGKPGYVVLEFPLYQAISAVLYKIIIPDIIIARSLSIFFSLLSILFVYRLTLKFLDKRAAIFASFFFAFAPLAIFYNRVPMPDSLTVLLSLVMLDFLISGINEEKNSFLIFGIIAACLGLVMKSPYIAPLYLPIAYVIFRQKQSFKSLLSVRFMIAFLIPFMVMILWQQHANAVNEIYFNTNNYPFNYLYSSVIVKLKPFNAWYFGTIDQSLEFSNYMIIWQRLSQEILSGAGVFPLAIGFFAVIRGKAGLFFYVWLFSVLCSVVLFFNLNIIHDFYQMPLVPILSIFCGAGLSQFIDFFRNKKTICAIITVFMVFYLFKTYTFTPKLFKESNNLVQVGQFIDTSIEKNAMIATSLPKDDVWDPQLMYYADRHGFAVPHRYLSKSMIEYLKNKQVKYLVVVDFEGEDNTVNAMLSHYKVVAKNERVKIFDISCYRQ